MDQCHQLAELDRTFNTKGALLRRWSDVSRKVADPDWYRRVEDAENAASALRMHHPVLIPGPLQTPEYTQTVLTYGRPHDSPTDIQDLTAFKSARAERLLALSTLTISAVLPEHVVRGCLGDAETAARQLQHLVDLAESGPLGLQIVPSGYPTHIGASTGAFELLTFVDRLPLVHAEHVSGGELVDDPREAQRIQSVYGLLQAWALSPAQSIELVRKVITC
ncbi:DUF5753 domain-containing protein [Nocardiopsis sediminis]|uniref:DUF5753 domain-containing protein n=1 Tax=Nocardiopsis sediminis TaxID=1778267 RepID=A0ABV8FLY5_9ACTN